MVVKVSGQDGRATRRHGWGRIAAPGACRSRSGPRAPALAADAFSTDWAASAKSQARLVAADAGLAGFEIRLAPGAITYWRDPGEAGVPPTFDFSGLGQCRQASSRCFPAPRRIAESDGSEAFGYEAGVVFPLRIDPRDPAKPVTLALQRQLRRLRENLPAGAGAPCADPARRSFPLRRPRRGGARRRAARRPAQGIRRA